MRSLYGIPFECQEREENENGVTAEQMIVVDKDWCDEPDKEDEALKACLETALACNFPSFGTIWHMEDESYPLTRNIRCMEWKRTWIRSWKSTEWKSRKTRKT